MKKNNPIRPVRPKVSVIIANYNSQKFIAKCLNSILAAAGNFEVIVVDDASTDQSRNMIKQFSSKDKKLKLISLSQRSGPSQARNIGVEASRGEYLMFLDTDTISDKDVIKNLHRYLDMNPEVAGGQIKILNTENPDRYDSAGEKFSPFGFLMERARWAKDTGQFDFVEPVFSGKAAGMFVRRSVFYQAGQFDPDYFIFWEEPDLFWRIWKTGHRVIYFPYSKIWHAFGTQSKPVTKDWLNQLTYYGCRNHLLTILKNGIWLQGATMFILIGTSWIGVMLLFLCKRDFSRAGAVMQALIWISANLTYIRQKRIKNIKHLKDAFYSDTKWWPNILHRPSVSWYLGKGIHYVLNRPF